MTHKPFAILAIVLAEGGGVGPSDWANVDGGATNKIFLM
jgi:hypothetical protein